MRYLVAVICCCGCLCSEGLMNSQACIAEHSQRQASNLAEIARLTSDYPVSDRMAELLRETAKSNAQVQAWIELTQAHVGRAEAPPEIMTSAEVGAQALYRDQIELEKKWRNIIPIKIPGIGNNDGGIMGLLAGGGPFALLSTGLGILLKKKYRAHEKDRQDKKIAKAAAMEAMDLIRTSPDPQIKKRAAKRANLVRVYADRKQDEYETRAMQLERGIDPETPADESV